METPERYGRIFQWVKKTPPPVLVIPTGAGAVLYAKKQLNMILLL